MESTLSLASLQALRIAEDIYLHQVEPEGDRPPMWVICVGFTRNGRLVLKVPGGLPLAFASQDEAASAARNIRPDIEPKVREDIPLPP